MKEYVLNTNRITTIRKALSTGVGREALGILNDLFYNKISFVPNDPYQTAFNEGHRDVIQFINNCVGFDSEHPTVDKSKGEKRHEKMEDAQLDVSERWR